MSSNIDRVVLGTRGSALALAQTALVASAIRAQFPTMTVEHLVVRTEGDRVVDRPISELGDKGVWVTQLEQELRDGRIDVAVHSLKDVPSQAEDDNLVLSGFLPRADARDVLVSRSGCSLSELAAGSVVGTGSLRRQVQLRSARPDLHYADIRGNVDTRLRKLRDGQYDALILAAAGLERLGLLQYVSEYLPVEHCTPDAGQGIIGLQTRHDAIAALAGEISHHPSSLAARSERAVVHALGADCRSPVGAYCVVQDGRLDLLGMAASEDGSRLFRDRVEGPGSAAQQLGKALGDRLRGQLERDARP